MDHTVNVESNWFCENESNISSCIKIVDNFPEENIFEILSEDQCISLKPPENHSSSCSLHIELINTLNCVPQIKQDVLPEDCLSHNGTCKDFTVNHEDYSSKLEDNAFSLNHNKSSNTNNYLHEIIILSEARFVELYRTPHMEYITTFNATLLSDFEDSKIYKTIITLNRLENSVSLKFKGLFSEESVWVYGIFVKVKQAFDRYQSADSKPLASVQDPIEIILKENNFVLSEKAEKFKMLLDSCRATPNMNSNTSSPFAGPFQAAFNMLNSQSLRPSMKDENLNFKTNPLNMKNPGDAGIENLLSKMQLYCEQSNGTEGISKYLNKTIPSINNSTSNISQSPTSLSGCDSAPTVNGDCKSALSKSLPVEQLINSIISEKIEQMEVNIVRKLEDKMAEVNSHIDKRLDRIESLLMKLTHT